MGGAIDLRLCSDSSAATGISPRSDTCGIWRPPLSNPQDDQGQEVCGEQGAGIVEHVGRWYDTCRLYMMMQLLDMMGIKLTNKDVQQH